MISARSAWRQWPKIVDFLKMFSITLVNLYQLFYYDWLPFYVWDCFVWLVDESYDFGWGYYWLSYSKTIGYEIDFPFGVLFSWVKLFYMFLFFSSFFTYIFSSWIPFSSLFPWLSPFLTLFFLSFLKSLTSNNIMFGVIQLNQLQPGLFKHMNRWCRFTVNPNLF